MRRGEVQSLDSKGFHRIRYLEWGNADNERVLVCVHGLVRNSRDFDDLAQALARDYRVVCPDLPGRGQSDWLRDGSDYTLLQYLQDMVALLARLGASQVDWIGTSLGGLIGICLAAQPDTPIRRLVLNDIGPQVSQQALQRISAYLGDYRFADDAELEQYLRRTYSALAGLSDAQWRHLALHGQRRCDDDQLALHYDPAIANNAHASAQSDLQLWPLWQQVSCPQLLLHGTVSDVLTLDTVDRMQRENPALVVQSLPGIGHAPSLMESEQIALIVDWLRATQNFG